jgi:hypothetical protein
LFSPRGFLARPQPAPQRFLIHTAHASVDPRQLLLAAAKTLAVVVPAAEDVMRHARQHAQQHAQSRTHERRRSLAHEAARLMAEGGDP